MDTAQEFITAIEEYYELEYSTQLEVKVIIEFLNRVIKADQLEVFFHKVTDAHSKKWKTLPDKAIMVNVHEKHHGSWMKIRAEKAWQSLMTVSVSPDVLIADPVAHFVVAGFVTWRKFCEERDGQYQEVVHKDFIDRYVHATKFGVDVRPRLLKGYYRDEYGPDFIGVETKIIGDKEEVRKLMDTIGIKYPLLEKELTEWAKNEDHR